jgi:phosphatidylglycerol:prolipoprotein diacylglycerol transferase
MLPILATIPPLPQTWFLPLCALVMLGGVASLLMMRRQSATVPATVPDAPGSMFAPLFVAAVICTMLYVWTRNPIKLHSYGLMLIVGFLMATWLSCVEARRRGYDPNLILDLALPLLLVTIICCRLLYVALNHHQFSSPAEIIRLWDGGLSFHGAIVGAVIVLAYFGVRSGLGFWKLADVVAPSVFLGYAWGRLGCFLNGCCYGGPSDLPWATVFRTEEHRHILTPPSHPAQIYSALLALGLFAFMYRARLQPQWNRFAGQLTLLFLALYAVERFIIEVFRNGATAKTMFGLSWLTQAQFTSILGLIGIAALWMWRARQSTLKPGESSLPTSLNPNS